MVIVVGVRAVEMTRVLALQAVFLVADHGGGKWRLGMVEVGNTKRV